jgi:hypothetical protein
MKYYVVMALLAFVTISAEAKVYKWVDENGTIHFTDTPYSQAAKEIEVNETGIELNDSPVKKQSSDNKKSASKENLGTTSKTPTKVTAPPEKEKIITEADYRINSSVGKLSEDALNISGRISSGPRCKDMTVTATARSDTGLSGTVTVKTKKINSFGSTTFSGTTRVSGSAADFGFWTVTKVTIRCNDPK